MDYDCNSCPCGGWSLGCSNTLAHPMAGQIPGKVHVDASEKYALLGTGKMLRRFLNLSGSW